MEIFGIVLFIVGLSGIFKFMRQHKHGVFTEAVVSKIEKGSRKIKASTYYHDIVYVTFRTENGEQITSKSNEERNIYHIGDTIHILYLRNKPKKIYLQEKNISALPFFIAFIGAVLTVAGFLYFP